MNKPNQQLVRIMRFTAFVISFLLVSALSYAQLNRSDIAAPTNGYEYLLYLPASYDGTEAYPMLLYLHGAQAMGNDISCSYGKGLPGVIKNNKATFDTLQMIIVAPHVKFGANCNAFNNDYTWDTDSINSVVQDVLNTYNIDNNRVFASGISLGAKGVWDYALTNPSLLAGIVPFSGNSETKDICDLSEVAVWAFHGEGDGLISITGGGSRKGSGTVVEKINECNPDIPAYLTTLEAKGHDGWDQTYDLTSGYDIYDWMFKIRKGKTTNIGPQVDIGPDITLLNPSNFKIKSFSYDPNGSITNYKWTQTSGASQTFNANVEDLVIDNFTGGVGSYGFELEVTDSEGLKSTASMTLNVVGSTTGPVVTELRLFYYDTDAGDYVDLGPIGDNQQIDSDNYDIKYLNIRATLNNMNSRASVRFSLNENHNFNTENDNNINRTGAYSISGQYVSNGGGLLKPSAESEYTINATAYGDRNATSPGVSKQATLILTANPLPVDIVSFTAHQKGNSVELTWQTASEVNNSHFEIFQGTNITSLEKVATVPKSNATTSLKNYKYSIKIETCGRWFFQLRNVDYDGHIDYSKIVNLDIKNDKCDLIYYPNPASDGKIFLSTNSLYKGMQLEIRSLDGRLVKEITLDQSTDKHFELDVSDIRSGIYLLHINNTNAIEPQRLVITH